MISGLSRFRQLPTHTAQQRRAAARHSYDDPVAELNDLAGELLNHPRTDLRSTLRLSLWIVVMFVLLAPFVLSPLLDGGTEAGRDGSHQSASLVSGAAFAAKDTEK